MAENIKSRVDDGMLYTGEAENMQRILGRINEPPNYDMYATNYIREYLKINPDEVVATD